mmetsp:Transcript_25643/g.54029  ORF Transcript_25643/g.54029 Transcript_25643/m.54029 type:complete len:343 (+) Transcript_25643:153-1181(+)
MRIIAAFSDVSLLVCSSFSFLLLLAMFQRSVSFTSPTHLAAEKTFRGLDQYNHHHHRNHNVFLCSQPAANSREQGDPEETLLLRRRENAWILLVDDEEPIRRAIGQFFSDKGYQVTACGDGKAALQVALGRKKDGMGETATATTSTATTKIPDCIVSDIRMPVMDGLEMLRNMRNNKEYSTLSHVPVVLLTAKAMVQDRILGYDSGADAYLTKPFAPEELVAIVDNVIKRSEDLSIENLELNKKVGMEDLRNDLAEIKDLLLHKGGGGIGNGWVEQTNIFLSKDERKVLYLLSRGRITKEIAAKTHLSTRRIEQLLTGMFRKTGVKNRTELVRWAVSTGNVE